MHEPDDSISCEVCELPHRAGVVTCESCRHALGTRPDWEGLRAELPGLKWEALLGGAILLVMLGLNIAVFGGFGYIILIAPVGWIVSSVYRYRLLSARLRSTQAREL